MKRTELNLTERRAIEDILHRNVKVTEIVRRINRHRATVYREIKRNLFKGEELPQLSGYYEMTAQKRAAERRARRRKLVRIPALRKAVIDRLQEGWSPEQIVGRLKLDGHKTTVNHETIYSYGYIPDSQPQALARFLPDRREKRKPRYARTPPGMMFPLELSIHNRPEQIKTRENFGAWEGDPQAPWQKGSVENLNKRARQYLPRDTPISTLSGRDMKAICERLNEIPRKCLGWRTPTEAFAKELKKLG